MSNIGLQRYHQNRSAARLIYNCYYTTFNRTTKNTTYLIPFNTIYNAMFTTMALYTNHTYIQLWPSLHTTMAFFIIQIS